MKNIVLIGMPGSGKSTIARKIAKIADENNIFLKIFDTDELITQKIKMPISEFFKKYGQEQFRLVETEIINEISDISDGIIASGGGVVLNPQNVQNLKKNGTIYFLNRSIKTLVKNCHCNDGKNTGIRPLIKTEQDIKNLYNQRIEIYKNSSDIQIDDNPSADFLARQILNLHLNAQQKIITAPPSKSYTHRNIICAALSNGKSTLSNFALNDDVKSTLYCISNFGANFQIQDDKINISGTFGSVRSLNKFKNSESGECIFECNESGSTLRFLIPLALALTNGGIFTGFSRLIERGIQVYDEIFTEQNISIKKTKNQIEIHGKLSPGIFKVRGNVSSQFISGLMFALPLLNGNSTILITTELESASYVDMTVQTLAQFGVKIEKKSTNEYFIQGNQTYLPKNLTIEGDWSNAAPFLALGFKVQGLNSASLQADKICVDLFNKLANCNSFNNDKIDISNCPDLGPILFSYAAVHNGATFTGTARLRLKESDRLQAMKDELNKFGVPVEIQENSVTIGKSSLQMPTQALDSHNDHRIVMALTFMLIFLRKKDDSIRNHTIEQKIISAQSAVAKSFPDFFQKLNQIQPLKGILQLSD